MIIIQISKTGENIESCNKILKILNQQLMLETLDEETINKIKNQILIPYITDFWPPPPLCYFWGGGSKIYYDKNFKLIRNLFTYIQKN